MGRTGRGNRAIHLDGNVVPETLLDRGVSEYADIRERKSLFWDGGHDHTGSTSGALVDLTLNLVSNSNFEHDITNGIGIPDFWYISGDLTIDIVNSGYFGTNAAFLRSEPPVFPSGTTSLFQVIPSPSGYAEAPPPSGKDFRSQAYGLGVYASGNGQICLGYHDTVDHWSSPHDLTDSWQWLTYRYRTDGLNNGIRVLLCIDGSGTIDNVLLNRGTRLISERPTLNYTDVDSWRKQNNMFNCIDHVYSIGAGDAAVVSPSGYAGVTLPRSAGAPGVIGVAIAASPSGLWVPLCNSGPAQVNVVGTVSATDRLCTDFNPSYPGYSISVENIADAASVVLGSIYPFAVALQDKNTEGPGQVLAYVNPTIVAIPTQASGVDLRPSIHLAPVYHGAVEGALSTDDAGDIRTGNDTDHNYYVWNYSQRGPDLSAAVSISGDMTMDAGTMEGSAMDIKSDEVYQEALLVGEIRSKYGNLVDKVQVKILNSSIYEQAWVEGAVDPGELMGAYGVEGLYARTIGNFALGGPARGTRPLGYPGPSRFPSFIGAQGALDGSTGGLPVGPVDGIVPSGWQPIGFDLRGATISGSFSMSTTGIYASGSADITPLGSESYSNSIITRIPVPRDYIGWATSGMYIWNKSTTGAFMEYQVLDISGSVVVSGGPLTNLVWTNTRVDIPSGTFLPNRWFTIQNTLTSSGNFSAYLGETSMYYNGYS